MAKRHSVISFHNLPVEIQEAVKSAYPMGYIDYMIRVDKPSGDFFYAVPFETEEVSYLVKVDVKIDDHIEEEEKDYYNDEIKGADDIADDEEEEDEDVSDRDDIDEV